MLGDPFNWNGTRFVSLSKMVPRLFTAFTFTETKLPRGRLMKVTKLLIEKAQE
jgi:hypothetical protein